MDHRRQETAVKHNQTFALLSNLRLLPPCFHHLIGMSSEVLIQWFYRDRASVGALGWFFLL